MTGTTAISAVLGLGLGAGLWLIVLGIRGTDVSPRRRRPADAARARARMILLALAVAAVVGLVTRWPAAALLAGLGAWWLPRLLGPDRTHAARLARIEAIASWSEMLRDTLSAAAGLEQAILATAPVAPVAVRDEIHTLAARLQRGEPLPSSLRAFAVDLDDPTGDLVVAALVMAAEHQARLLGELLGSLAVAAREQAAMRLRVAAQRARTRTSVRVIVGTTLLMAGGLVLLNRGYLAPYGTAMGQLVLLSVGALFTVSFGWLTRMAAAPPAARVLAPVAERGGVR